MAEFDLATLHEAIAVALVDDPCIIDGRAYTWGETTDRTRRFAAFLRDRGLGGRRPTAQPWESGQDHLGICLHNGASYLEVLLGTHKASVTPFNINHRYTAAELAYLLRDAAPKALVYGGAFADVVGEAIAELTDPPLLIRVHDSSDDELLSGAIDYEVALAMSDPDDGIPDASPSDRHIIYTGGTTGMPKGVLWRVGDLIAGPLGVRNAETVADVVARALRVRGRVMPTPPLMHGAGSGFALGGWLGGATVVFPDRPQRFDAADVWDACDRHDVTSMAIVGDAFGAPLVKELKERQRALPALKLIVSSGAALSQGTKDQLHQLIPHVRVSDVLGSSETGLHAKRGGQVFEARGDAAVVDETRTRVLRPGSEEIGWFASGGRIPMGYLGDPDKTRNTFVDIDGRRYSVTGDRAKALVDGTFEFLGREATTINTGGEKVYADEVESAVRAVPGVLDVVVVGRPNPRWGQEVVALYQSENTRLDARQLADDCRKTLAGYKIPKQFIRVEKVARHANGKTDYAWARAVAEQEHA
ncbi:AMP-binding protein [Mycobacteroides immunogenum]|uniref:AMP-dependent synthetase n=1 Tax=Mycobacteroides immunogenum TaxID=83262 RepID=A0A7V8LJT9_9MYCO|nr:AMP-binding protein [Mycobacteroides immunogenum]AMT72306.1 AMP-dependent synthetase [Mycobacteroides immunogenum]ANO05446.1 AMP-dependent synthetase [Mycobacteroides immunogenum]KIU37565.1 AMP-dependent synthetase [Mycobacteroides immunogenum]KPG02985.1 AMP-dependent synthetase [Mycobacteroides immunogenum]KPG03061.1 AMP-dependent synthetase [Mycobacteroides immunogenum]